MKNHNASDGILVFDRYYSKKPVPALLAAGRVMFCGLISAAAMLYIFSQYEMDVPLLNIGLYAGISAALFSVLLIFVKRRYALPALFVPAGAAVWLNLERFWESFSYFVDEAMLLVDGRFLYPRGYVLHDFAELTWMNFDYREGMLLGSFILCALYGLLCAATMTRRIRAVPAAVGFMVLCVPMLLSERLEIDIWFIPFAVLLAAAVAVELNYRDGLALPRGGSSSYRMQLREEERKFLAKTDGAGIFRRAGMHLSYYSKYATSGAYCAVLFAVTLGIGCKVFGDGAGIDYRELYRMATNFGEHEELSDSSVSDYFASAGDENARLNISSPGNGNEDILRVTFTGEENIYLRGDIGVDFVSNSWTTPVNSDDHWRNSSLSERYRPCELLIIEGLRSNEQASAITSDSDITIEYLTETDVVFLPAYTTDHSFYDNYVFDIYGDYVVRVSDSAENYINSVRCQAIMLSADTAREAVAESDYGKGYLLGVVFKGLFPDIEDGIGVLGEYRSFVRERYTAVPDNMSAGLADFLNRCGFYENVTDADEQMYAYNAAEYLGNYLAENYTYSLNGGNSGENMLFSFLNETRTGHCSLYASSMTLLLREAGIPARYCTGFSIYPDSMDRYDAQSGEDGYTIVLKEKNLHAWVEVYLDDFGWVTFDPTSAAVRGLGGNGAQQLPEREETVQARPETEEHNPVPEQPEHTEETPIGGNDNRTEDDGRTLGIVLSAVAAVIAVAAVVFTVKMWRVYARNADRAVAEAHPAKELYDCLIDIAELCGISHEAGQLPADYYRACDERFSADLSDIGGVLEAAAFGNGELTDDENGKLRAAFGRVYSSAIKNSGVLRRLKIRRLVAARWL